MAMVMAEEIKDLIQRKPEALLCIAAGNTSLELFKALIRMSKNREIDFSNSYFVAMDEWVGMNRTTPGSCSDFLERHFLREVIFKEVRLADGLAKDLTEECGGIKKFIDNCGGIDYLVLGCGMNGHIALNEPGVDFDSTVHVTELDEVTKKVGQKYFEGQADLKSGITIGISEIKAAKRVVLAFETKNKQEIFYRVLNGEVSNQIPATVIKQIPNSMFICEETVIIK